MAESQNIDESWDTLEDLRHLLGFNYCGVGVAKNVKHQGGVSLLRGSPKFDRAADDYCQRQLDKNDPSAKALGNGQSIVFANETLASAPPKDREGAQQVSDFIRGNGFYSHAAISISLPRARGSGFLAFGVYDDLSIPAFRAMVLEKLPILRLGSMAYANTALYQQKAQGRDLLTKAERSVLRHLADGLKLEEIAESESKSVSTVRRQSETARKRLGARNTLNAVWLAQQLGLLDL